MLATAPVLPHAGRLVMATRLQIQGYDLTTLCLSCSDLKTAHAAAAQGLAFKDLVLDEILARTLPRKPQRDVEATFVCVPSTVRAAAVI